MAPSTLQLTNPQEYFREKVTVAVSQLKMELDDHVEFYLVNLLCDFIDPTKVNAESAGDFDIFEQPLAFMLQKALESPPSTQLKQFKSIGDSSLYVAGYFQDYFNRKAFDLSYYITVGANAYIQVSNLLRERRREDHFPKVYETMADNFQKLVDVVAEIADSHGNNDNNNILAIYDRWNRVKSERLRRILEKQGIHPIATPFKIAQ